MVGRRHQKDWFEREKKVMEKLGLRPQPQSGAGWRKEDGENDYVLCQLKSTDGQSIRVDRLDVEKLFYHADCINKIPIFVMDFVNGPLLIGIPPEELGNIADYLNKGLFEKATSSYVEMLDDEEDDEEKEVLESSSKSVHEILADARELNWQEPEKEESKGFIFDAFKKRNG